ncbi:hypothetical protein CkaCkLH20_10933 [Colletotrichum karsti]|uniref:Uncharacterized protein n=1 Tax=Colletotrichum karsti TaxID=1095194 RepID=A0A9P6HWY1_9PEZI|nr:uncharacterized protein CkaCkLH20_10933 [Colletotrichum karsti]KAF9871522.1 hypothetical protein CkaCkLH20_10933 [Colletotrichum karsti]
MLFKKFEYKERRDHKRVGNRRVYLETTNLKAKMLGKHARTVIMRDEPIRPPRILPVEDLTPEEIDLDLELERMNRGVTMEEALAHIDELRPSDSIVYQSEFEELFDKVHNGFTVAQVRAYLIRESSAVVRRSAKEEVEYDWLEGKQSWTPARTLETAELLPKERLVMTLMKEAWKLELREVVDGVGTLFTKANELFLSVLARDGKRLSFIRDTYLDEGEKIFVHRMLRIHATKAKTDTILKELDKAAKDMVSHTIEPVGISRNDVDTRLLSHLGRLMNCTITLVPGKKTKIRVSWLRDGSPEEGRERPDNVVRRLLHTALYPRHSTVTLKYPEDAEGRLIPQAGGREKLSWLDRVTQWSRWMEPIGRLSSYESDDHLKVSEVLPRPLRAPQQDSDETWSKPYTSAVASFGQILHQSTGSFSIDDAAENITHIFSPTSPPPASLATLSDAVTKAGPVTTSLILTFRPHPTVAGNLSRDLPGLLELHLTVPDDLPEGPLTWDSCPKRLVAVQRSNIVDVAYPSQPIDLRISQPDLRTMSASALDSSPFREYIDSAKLDLLAGRLGPPPQITLSGLPSATRAGGTIDAPVDYMFTGLEMRRTLEAEYQGHKLQYNSIQAGHHGGRRAELVLEATPPDESLSKREKTAHTEKYIRLVEDLARGDVVKWVGERDLAAEQAGPVRKVAERHAPAREAPQESVSLPVDEFLASKKQQGEAGLAADEGELQQEVDRPVSDGTMWSEEDNGAGAASEEGDQGEKPKDGGEV